MENIIRISVRNLIEFTMRSGDIDTGFVSPARAMEGIRAHQKLQSEYGEGYSPEYLLRNETLLGSMLFVVEGRADGVIKEEGSIVIDEIKSTSRELDSIEEEHNPMHWAQVYCYAYFYGVSHGMQVIQVQLSYYNVDEDRVKRFRRTKYTGELWEFYEGLLAMYLEFSKKRLAWRRLRDESLTDLSFPFASYRRGQREMAVAVYRTIEDRKTLFVDAPTGIGKTISALYPALKAIGEKFLDKIFYLTARGTGKESGAGAIRLLLAQGLHIKAVVLTAKEKSCINDVFQCNPRDCSFAKGHFDRINAAIIDILDTQELITNEVLQEYAYKHRVCPFEYQLDLANYCDQVICDYNYVFDPRVRLRRFFEGALEEYALLVDEAHNLIDRGRSMFSAQLDQRDVKELDEHFQGEYKNVDRALKRLLTGFEALRMGFGEKREYSQVQAPQDFYPRLRNLQSKLEPYLSKEKKAEGYEGVLELYFQIRSFLRIAELYDEGYRTLFSLDQQENIQIKLLCVDTKTAFQHTLKGTRAAIYFSATLTPMDFYRDLLGGAEDSYKYHLPSPFDPKNLYIAALVGVSTKYMDRGRSVEPIIESIEALYEERPGNYLIFFPSYQYMLMVSDRFQGLHPDWEIAVQQRGMGEGEREEFLQAFVEGGQRVAFAVMGGVFSEGIDLVGTRLVGAVVVSVGLPMLGFERDIIREYFDEKLGCGFEYAYQYPGMNKVMQGAGRLIRTEGDLGAVLLIDARFALARYRKLMPAYWSHIRSLYETDSLRQDLKEFYRQHGIEIQPKQREHPMADEAKY
ncbi:MAG: ATP-dependent DNA helicase [Tissierellia bacterium]|nr:ATP-dependent DNA helicase [Tissierellia bacterium]